MGLQKRFSRYQGTGPWVRRSGARAPAPRAPRSLPPRAPRYGTTGPSMGITVPPAPRAPGHGTRPGGSEGRNFGQVGGELFA